MSLSEISAAITAVKLFIPAFEHIVSDVKAHLPQDKADLVAAVAAVEKVIGDLKAAVETVIAAAK